MKRYVVFCYVCLSISALIVLGSTELYAQTRIAIMPFKNVVNEEKYNWISDGFSESLTSAFAQLGKFIVIERGQINNVFQEQRFQLTDLVDETKAVELGKLLGAEKLVIGSFQIFEGIVNINSRIVNVETGQIDDGGVIRNLTGPLNQIFALQEQMCMQQAQCFGLEITEKEREKVAVVTTQSTNSIDAYEFYVKARQKYLLYGVENVEKSIKLYEKALAIDENYGLALSGISESYASLGSLKRQLGGEYKSKQEKSLDYAKRAVKIAPMLAEAHRGLGLAYINLPSHEGIQYLKEAIRLNPNDAESYLFLNRATEGSNPDGENFKTALKLNPKLYRIYMDRGGFYFRQGDYAKAAADFEKMVKLSPNNPTGYINLGVVCLELGDDEKAMKYLTKSVEMYPNAVAYVGLGVAQRNSGEYDKAIETIRKAITMAPDNPDAYYNLAICYSLINSVENALKYLELALDKAKSFNQIKFYNSVWNMKNEKKFDNIKNTKKFKKLVKKYL